MKKIFYLAFTALILACSPEETITETTIDSTNQQINLKNGNGIGEIPIDDLRDLLALNSEILIHMIYGSVNYQTVSSNYIGNTIQASIEPITRTVKMSDLFNNNTFRVNYSYYLPNIINDRLPLDHSHINNPNYSFINQVGSFRERVKDPMSLNIGHNFIGTMKPDANRPWPPRQINYTVTGRTETDASVNMTAQEFINKLIEHEIEIYIPNDFNPTVATKDRFVVYHPLIDVQSTYGFRKLHTPRFNNGFTTYGYTELISYQQILDGEFIVLSRPSLETKTYSYINFDITTYLSDTSLSGLPN